MSEAFLKAVQDQATAEHESRREPIHVAKQEKQQAAVDAAANEDGESTEKKPNDGVVEELAPGQIPTLVNRVYLNTMLCMLCPDFMNVVLSLFVRNSRCAVCSFSGRCEDTR